MSTFQEDLRRLINICSQENVSNTPDFILAQFIDRCLFAFNLATHDRDTWYGIKPEPGKRAPDESGDVGSPK